MAFRAIGADDKGVPIGEGDRNWIYTIWSQPKRSHDSDKVTIPLQLSHIIGAVIYHGAETVCELYGPSVSRRAAHAARWQRLYE